MFGSLESFSLQPDEDVASWLWFVYSLMWLQPVLCGCGGTTTAVVMPIIEAQQTIKLSFQCTSWIVSSLVNVVQWYSLAQQWQIQKLWKVRGVGWKTIYQPCRHLSQMHVLNTHFYGKGNLLKKMQRTVGGSRSHRSPFESATVARGLIL